MTDMKTKKDTFRVPVDRLEAVIKKITKENERLTASKSPLIDFSVSEPFQEYRDESKLLSCSFVDITLSRALQSNKSSFEVIALTQIDPGTKFQTHTRFRTLSDEEENVLTNSEDPCKCDHCNKSIPRTFTYLIKNEEKQLRVGSGCVDKYTLTNFKKWFKSFEKVEETLSDAESSFNPGIDYKSINFIEYFTQIVESRIKKNYEKHYEVYSRCLKAIQNGVPLESSEEARELAGKIIMRAMEDFSKIEEHAPEYDSLKNFNSLIMFGVITESNTFLASSIAGNYIQKFEKESKQEKNADLGNNLIGEEKGKLSGLQVTCLSATPKESDYGGFIRIEMKDQEDNLIQWDASNNKDKIEPGDTFKLSGTVKRHAEWYSRKYEKNVKVTIMTRCKTDKKTHELENSPEP